MNEMRRLIGGYRNEVLATMELCENYNPKKIFAVDLL